jgi:uncharacterized protein
MNSYLPNDINDLVKQLQLIPHPEGGFFRETHRSGGVPMSSRGLTDTSTATSNDTSWSLVHVATTTASVTSNVNVTTSHHDEKMSSKDRTDIVLRNAMTSIYWVPSIKSPILTLGSNLSDHVHYYQGGGYAFAYYIYTPITGGFRTEILGPNLAKGHKLQVSVFSGEWKCGHLVSLEYELNEDQNENATVTTIPSALSNNVSTPEYVVIGEGVGPGFDVHDFNWITESDIDNTSLSVPMKSIFKQYLHRDTTVLANKEQHFDQHYDNHCLKDK